MNSRFSSMDSFDFRSGRSKDFQITSKDLDLGGASDGDDSGSHDERGQHIKDIDLGTSDENDDSGSGERSQAVYSS